MNNREELIKLLAPKHLLHYVGILVLTICSIYGMLYLTKGNDIISILVGMLIGGAFYALVAFMVQAKEEFARTIFGPKVKIGLILYMVLFMLTSVVLLHFVNLEFSLKNKIIDEMLGKVKLREQMYAMYEKLAMEDTAQHASKIRAGAYGINYGNRNLPILDQEPYASKGFGELKKQVTNSRFKDLYNDAAKNFLANEWNRIAGDFLPAMKDSMETENAEFKSIAEQWRRTKLAGAFYGIDNKIGKDLNHFQRIKSDFSFDISSVTSQSLSLNDPAAIMAKQQTNLLLSFLVLLLVHGLILWPFLFTKSVGIFGSDLDSHKPDDNDKVYREIK